MNPKNKVTTTPSEENNEGFVDQVTKQNNKKCVDNFIHLEKYTFDETTGILKIEDGVKEIKQGDLKGIDKAKIKKVIIPEGVNCIHDRAFSGCENLTQCELPETVTRIENDAFARCGFDYFYVPDSVNFLGKYAFYKCKKLESPCSSFTKGSQGNANHSTELCLLLGKHFPIGHVSIPFHLKDSFQKTLYSDDTSIVYEVRTGKVNPERINSDELFKQYFILKDEELIVKSREALSNTGLAYNVPNVKKITIQPGLKRLGTAFLNLKFLEKVDFPDSVEEIWKAAFRGCIRLKNVKLPGKIKAIAEETFFDCYSLENVEIPEGVTKIGKNAFRNCSNLSYLKIPDSVDKIEGLAFYGCKKLTLSIPEKFKDYCEKNKLNYTVRNSKK